MLISIELQLARSTRTPIIIDGKTKYTCVGNELQGTLHTNHFVRQPPGIALRVEAVDQAERLNVASVVITHFETRDTYYAPLNLFREKAIHRNYGYGDQLVLTLGFWNINGQIPAVEQRGQLIKVVKIEQPTQLTLFGGVA